MDVRTPAPRREVPTWLVIVGPLFLAAVLVALLVGSGPVAHLRRTAPPGTVAVERAELHPGVIRLHVRNAGSRSVTVAQVQVNDAFWRYTARPHTLGRLGTSTVTVDYPWEPGQPVRLAVLTSDGVVVEHDIPNAAATPTFGGRTLTDYGLLGVAIGVVPVALGLLWMPALRRAPARWLHFFLALTVGLLAFLLAETTAEGLERAGDVPASLRGVELFVVGALGVVAVMAWLQGFLGQRAHGAGGDGGGEDDDDPGVRPAGPGGLALAALVAVGIGVHNLGEGLAVGSAVATGASALGTSLVIGFAAHNTTEGLAIASPLGDMTEGPSVGLLALLAVVAGGPAVLGAWLGALALTPAWAALSFGVAAGAIAQVMLLVGRSLVRSAGGVTGPTAVGFLTGVLLMYVTALAAA